MVLVKVPPPITRDKVIPRVLFMGVPSLETTYFRHIFGLDGSITIRDEQFEQLGYELKINPVDYGFTGTVELYEDVDAQIVMVSYKFRYRGKDYEIQVYFYFGVDYGNKVKVKIKGILPRAGNIKIPFQAVTHKLDVFKRRFWSGILENGELLSGVGFDWSDVTVSSSFDETAKTLEFSVGSVFELDPSTVSTTTVSTATQMPHQRKTFYKLGRHWVFYVDGIFIKFSSSTDGVTWATPTDIASGTMGRQFSVWLDGNYVHLTRSPEGAFTGCYYMRGLLNADGTITLDAEQWSVPPRFEDEGGYQRDALYLAKLLLTGSIYRWGDTYGAFDDYTTEINTGDVGAGCKTPFNPYVTVNADNFGYATIGASTLLRTANYKIACRFQAPRTESITKIKAYMRLTTAGQVRAGIYSDSASTPASLLGSSGEVSVGTSFSWVEFTFATPISVTSGSYYWLALIFNQEMEIRADAGATGQTAWNSDTYADGFSDPFGTPTYGAYKLSIFAYSTSLPASIGGDGTPRGWQYAVATTRRRLWALDGRFPLYIKVGNPTAVVHAGNLYARIWVSANIDLSGATVWKDWVSAAVSFSGTAGQMITVTINVDKDNAVGSAFALENQYFFIELLWDVTTAATDARVQVEGTAGGSNMIPPAVLVYMPNIIVDSNGYPWIGYMNYNGIGYYPYVAKGNATGGTWAMRLSSYRKLSATTVLIGWRVTPIPLTAGKVRAIYHRTAAVYSDLWDGSTWTAQDPPAISLAQAHGLSAINDGDDTIFGVLEATTYHIKVIKHTYGVGWDASYTTVQSSTGASTILPVLSWISTNKFIVFWAGSPTADHIYYKIVTNMTPDTDPTDWIYEDPTTTGPLTGNDRLTCFYKNYSNYIGLVYMTKTTSPYNVRYAFISLLPPVAIQYSDGLVSVLISS